VAPDARRAYERNRTVLSRVSQAQLHGQGGRRSLGFQALPTSNTASAVALDSPVDEAAQKEATWSSADAPLASSSRPADRRKRLGCAAIRRLVGERLALITPSPMHRTRQLRGDPEAAGYASVTQATNQPRPRPPRSGRQPPNISKRGREAELVSQPPEDGRLADVSGDAIAGVCAVATLDERSTWVPRDHGSWAANVRHAPFAWLEAASDFGTACSSLREDTQGRFGPTAQLARR
jgi:hypothetical protein